MPQDATPEFKQQLKVAFDALEVGQTFTFRRTFTEGDVALFCGVSGDYNPYHVDQSFVEQSWFGRRIIPGLLTASMMTHIGGMIGFLATEMSFQFVTAVYPGDTITCTVTILEKDAARRMMRAKANFVNQDGVEVVQASFAGFPSQVRLAR
jgi:3-hydroxybutyryl-CoA dehydratase